MQHQRLRLYFLPWATYGRCTASSPALPTSPQAGSALPFSAEVREVATLVCVEADETLTEEADERQQSSRVRVAPNWAVHAPACRGMRYLKYVLYPLSAGWGLPLGLAVCQIWSNQNADKSATSCGVVCLR